MGFFLGNSAIIWFEIPWVILVGQVCNGLKTGKYF